MKSFIRSIGLLEIAILINAAAIVFMHLFPFALLVLVIAWLRECWIRKEKGSLIPTRNFYYALIPFGLTLFGLVYTSNFKQGMGDLGRMMPYFIFPITLFSMEKNRFKIIEPKVIAFFVSGLVLRFLMDLYASTIRFLNGGNINDFFYAYLDSDTNIFSVLTLLGILLVIDCRINRNAILSRTKLLGYFSVIFFLTVGLLLLQSRIVIVCFYLALAASFLYYWNRNNKFDVLLVGAFCSLLLLFPVFQGRFQVVSKETIQLGKKDMSVTRKDTLSMNCMSSTSLRLNAVKTSVLILKQHPILGVGTGDWRDEMFSIYNQEKMPCNAKEHTAPHNQYLRIGVKNGFFGILIYFFFIFILLKKLVKYNRMGQFPFFLSLVLCGFGYDILDVGSSAPVFAFFSTWLFFTKD
jgi:O-antigen ligase